MKSGYEKVGHFMHCQCDRLKRTSPLTCINGLESFNLCHNLKVHYQILDCEPFLILPQKNGSISHPKMSNLGGALILLYFIKTLKGGHVYM